MKVTILWEDQRGAAVRAFGPHALLVACISDECGQPAWELDKQVTSIPKKGVGNVRAALQKDRTLLEKSGPLFAVIDRDKVHDLWKHAPKPPTNCMAGIRDQLRRDAPGDYDVVFLIQNVESLLAACCAARGVPPPPKKPNPDLRDELFHPACDPSQRRIRSDLRAACSSFDRLVVRVTAAIRASPNAPAPTDVAV